MAYIGKEPIVGNFQVCDTISTSATATFNLLVSSVAVFPETENNVICSLNGVVQKPGSGGGFTISGSTIVFKTEPNRFCNTIRFSFKCWYCFRRHNNFSKNGWWHRWKCN